jgi:hypothetical protein
MICAHNVPRFPFPVGSIGKNSTSKVHTTGAPQAREELLRKWPWKQPYVIAAQSVK